MICIIMEGLDSFDSNLMNTSFNWKYGIWLGITFLLTAITSVIASVVIGAQIYSSTAKNPAARRRYSTIIEIIMQSSALYSLTILCQAIATLMSATKDWPMDNVAAIYSETIMTFTTVRYLPFDYLH